MATNTGSDKSGFCPDLGPAYRAALRFEASRNPGGIVPPFLSEPQVEFIIDEALAEQRERDWQDRMAQAQPFRGFTEVVINDRDPNDLIKYRPFDRNL